MIEHRRCGKEMNAFIKALPGVFDAIDASDEVRQAFVFAAWRRVSGAQVSERTSPVSIEGRKLIVAVSDKTWKRNLESLAPQLLFKLNGMLGRDTVDHLEFSIAPDHISVREPINNLSAESPAMLPDELANSLGKIRDGELRQTVSKAAKACLSLKQEFSYLDSEKIN